MNERKLIKKLNNLKNIKPDNNWKKNYQEILYSQISANRLGTDSRTNLGIIWQSIMPRQILANLAKPVWVSLAASILILVVGIGGVYASKNSKPGDSLYIAKIISEKAKFAITFDEEDKAKLGVEFAVNRAREMKLVLDEADQVQNYSSEKIEQLSQNFKKEISQVKSRLNIINKAAPVKSEDSEVFGANLGRSNERLEIAEQVEPSDSQVKTNTSTPALLVKPESASSTPEVTNTTDKMLEEVEKLFDEGKLDETIGALEEVGKSIGEPVIVEDMGQVQGESETATSTK